MRARHNRLRPSNRDAGSMLLAPQDSRYACSRVFDSGGQLVSSALESPAAPGIMIKAQGHAPSHSTIYCWKSCSRSYTYSLHSSDHEGVYIEVDDSNMQYILHKLGLQSNWVE